MSTTTDDLRNAVRQRYAEAAPLVSEVARRAIVEAASAASTSGDGGYGAALYSDTDRAELPQTAVLASSLGCGNPTAVADLREGETVLDLGSGGGIDVILSPHGRPDRHRPGDMTDEMLALAQKNAREADVSNVHFLKGVIEQIPLPANSVDVVISNCVINLSTDKPAVLAEISRVLKPGGRIGISDIVAEDHLTPEDRAERAWVGCTAGALSRSEYTQEAGLEAAGFENVSVEFTYEAADGMHGAIVKGAKTSEPMGQGSAGHRATKAGCC